MTSSADNPRSVTPGIENKPDSDELHAPGVYVGLDWIRLTGPVDVLNDVERMMQDMCQCTPKTGRGGEHFNHGLTWDPGVMLSWGHRARICQADFRGSALRLLNGDDRMKLLRRFMEKGMRPTRIDGALDYIDQDRQIHKHATASCQCKELCRLRKWNPDNEYDVPGIPSRLLLKLGARASAVCGRIYDKGLQRGVAECGRWERIEIEWKKDRAYTVGMELYESGEKWPELLTSLIFGAVDFRERNGRTKLSERPRAKWWDDLLIIEPKPTKPLPREKVFQKWKDALRIAFGPRLLQMAWAADVSVGELVTWMLEDLDPKSDDSPIIYQFLNAWQEARI